MAEPVNFPEANVVFKAPIGEEEICGELPCFRDSEQPLIVSCWQLTDEEIEELKINGGKIFLYNHSSGIAPTALSTLGPVFE